MKRKLIEKIPYIGLKKVAEKESVKYVAAAEIKDIGEVQHLFLEVYKNDKEHLEVPVARIVVSDNDFDSYIPEKDLWTKKKILNSEYYSDRPFWYENGENCEDCEAENALRGTEDLKAIIEISKPPSWYEKKKWWKCIKYHQDEITGKRNNERERRKSEIRQQALKDRMDHTQELPEERILQYAENEIFHNKHIIFYKKRGSWVRTACSACGGATDSRWKLGISYESNLQRYIEDVKEGHYGQCPLCGAMGIFKPQGKYELGVEDTKQLYLIQPFKEGIVVRYVEVYKEWQMEEVPGKKGPELLSASEVVSGKEIERAYFEPGKPVQKDFHKRSGFSGEEFWDDCNLHGMASIVPKNGRIMPESYEALDGTAFQYCALKEYRMEEGVDIKVIDYLERYAEYPQMELLTKMGLHKVVTRLLKWSGEIVCNKKARNPEDFLGIRKGRVKLLIQKEGSLDILRVLKMERSLRTQWSEEQIKNLSELLIQETDLAMILQYMSVQQFLNRVKRYAGCEYGTHCLAAENQLNNTAQRYKDYLNMRIELDFDLNNSIYQYPRDLKRAHDEMVRENNARKTEKGQNGISGKYGRIANNYKKLWKQYYHEDDTYCIRPAMSEEEIIQEGRILKHCVGGDGYLRNHDRGVSYILMLRFKEKPDEPYITVEIRRDAIVQWYGRSNGKPDKKNMKKWLDKYINRLRCGRLNQGEKNMTENDMLAGQELTAAV